MSQKQVSDHHLTPNSENNSDHHLFSLTLPQALEGYINALKAERQAPRTIENKENILNLLVGYGQANSWPPVPGITTRHLRQFLAEIQQRPRWFGRQGDGRPISTSYYETIYRRLKTFFNWLVNDGEIPENPMDRIKHPKLEERVIPTVPDDDFERLVHLTDPDLYHSPQRKFRALRDRAALFLLGDTSLRREGLASLEMEDVNLEERWVLAMEKGRKERYADLGPSAAKALWRYLAARDNLHPATQALWVDARGEPMKPQWVNQMLKRLGKRAGIPNVHPHRFRHSFTVVMTEEGTPESVLEIMGGWRKIPDTYKATIGRKQAREWHQKVSPLERRLRRFRKKAR